MLAQQEKKLWMPSYGSIIIALTQHNEFLCVVDPWKEDEALPKFPGGAEDEMDGGDPLVTAERESRQEAVLAGKFSNVRHLLTIKRDPHSIQHFSTADLFLEKLRLKGNDGELPRLYTFDKLRERWQNKKKFMPVHYHVLGIALSFNRWPQLVAA